MGPRGPGALFDHTVVRCGSGLRAGGQGFFDYMGCDGGGVVLSIGVGNVVLTRRGLPPRRLEH